MSETNNHIQKYLAKNLRYDGRKKDEYREIETEVGLLKTAEGSSRVKIGATEVIVGIKMSVETPYPDSPNKGTMMVGAELLPLSSEEFEPGPPSRWAIEVARVIDRGIRESNAIDTKKLCIEEGEKVWAVLIDVCPINYDGNLLDAAGLGVMLALQNTRLPKCEDGKIDYKEKTDTPLPLAKATLATTIYKIGQHLIVDPSLEEEKMVDSRLTASFTEEGDICALQKGGDDALTADEIKGMASLAKEKNSFVRSQIGGK